MHPNEIRYRRVLGSIGLAMLSFLALFNVLGTLLTFFDQLLELLPLSAMLHEVIYQLTYAAVYLASFMLPVLVMRWIFDARGLSYRPMQALPKISPWLPLILLGGISLILVQANLNAILVSLIDYSIDDLVTVTASTQPYQVVLQFITVCLVPGFCEEFLFRGAIQTNCRPFGRVPAILISATLFALMHQNVGQTLYTFAAGILLGIVYEYTGSIWNCVILHVANNFFSVVESTLFENLTEQLGGVVCTILETVLFLLGAVSLTILVVRFFGKRPTVENGFFGRELPATDRYAELPVAPSRMFSLALTPSMLIFCIFAVLQMLLLVCLSSFSDAIL